MRYCGTQWTTVDHGNDSLFTFFMETRGRFCCLDRLRIKLKMAHKFASASNRVSPSRVLIYMISMLRTLFLCLQ